MSVLTVVLQLYGLAPHGLQPTCLALSRAAGKQHKKLCKVRVRGDCWASPRCSSYWGWGGSKHSLSYILSFVVFRFPCFPDIPTNQATQKRALDRLWAKRHIPDSNHGCSGSWHGCLIFITEGTFLSPPLCAILVLSLNAVHWQKWYTI